MWKLWFWLFSCQSDESGVPPHFPSPAMELAPEVVELGRWLFYDQQLSINGTRSCGVCHEQAKAFTDGLVRAVGATNEVHGLNSASLVNVGWRESFSWSDDQLNSLNQQLLRPLFGEEPIEMGMTEMLVIERLRSTPHYSELFARAFPESEQPISLENVITALVQFQHRIVSGDSPYDRWLLGEAELSSEDLLGLELFESDRLGCRECHGGLFFDAPRGSRHGYANTGLYNIDGLGGLPGSQGLIEYTGVESDRGKFRIPSLRNVTLTGPWGHDGSFLSLADVIDSYARGGRLILGGPNAGDGALSPYRDSRIRDFELSSQERSALLSFLKSLEGDSIQNAPHLSSPFCIEISGVVSNAPCEEQSTAFQ